MRIPSVRISAVIAVAIAAGVIAWLIVGGRGGKKSVKAAQAQAVSAQSLAALPSEVHHPVYWAGPKAGFTYELTRTSDGRTFNRYLPAGVRVGTNQPKYLTIAWGALIRSSLQIDRIRLRGRVRVPHASQRRSRGDCCVTSTRGQFSCFAQAAMCGVDSLRQTRFGGKSLGLIRDSRCRIVKQKP